MSDREEAVRDMLRFSLCALIVFVIKGFFGKVLFNAFTSHPCFVDDLWEAYAVVVLEIIRRYCSAGSTVYIDLPLCSGFEYETRHPEIERLDRVVAEAAKLAGATDVVTTDHYSIQAWALYHWPSDSTGSDRYASPTGQVVPNEMRRQNQYDNWDVLDSPKPSLVHISRYSEDLAMRCLAFRAR